MRSIPIGATIIVEAMSQSDALKLLELPPNADADAIKQAYRKAAMKYHPDRGGSEDMMKKVNEAHDVLQGGGSSGGRATRPAYYYDKEAEKAKEQKYKDATDFVVNELKSKFKPDGYTQYFTDTIGKTFKLKKLDVASGEGGRSVILKAEWASDDGETVFSLYASVPLVQIVFSTPSLSGGGGVHVVSFPVEANTTILHQRRKIKFTQRSWERKDISQGMNDPTVLFPKPQMLSKVASGKSNLRPLSKRDMLLALNKMFDAQVYSGSVTSVLIPLNPKPGTNLAGTPMMYGLLVEMYRTVMLSTPAWSFGWVKWKEKGENDIRARVGSITLPESEVTLDLLKDLRAKLRSETDPRKASEVIDQLGKKVRDAWLKNVEAPS
jgi:hypothetical protein